MAVMKEEKQEMKEMELWQYIKRAKTKKIAD